ncbi:pectinesterase family protein [Sphaerobacter thermophilus]|uniref:Ig domain protein group 1 domain protein n=1 Tax=Sphaerobacter thermophilus (strain ATCC 49802 / DSM 20745 / KCCM 41009 / NCIMB 13125 / S 6022) TaxID=479434 RepID=D1CB02_SPHTD|nr:pectinesterase family protein [Sphaerobacter thermophilus]ACZ39949.1 Ig domain protein group 1 domain protein [Sphaerobacter thermophilus DSM 20745]
MVSSVRARRARRPSGVLARAIRLVSVLALIAALGAALVPAGPASAQADRWVAVGGDDDGNDCLDEDNPCATIQHAIDVAESGDTIHVGAGTYREDLTLPADKSGLTLSGAGVDRTSITGVAGNKSYTITLTSADTTIEGFTIRRPAGVENSIAIAWGYQGSGSTVRNTVITGYPTGIYVSSGVDGATITNNTISGNGNGILLEARADNVTIASNNITGNNVKSLEPEGGAGIRFLSEFTGSGNRIAFNRIAGNVDGMGINNQSTTVLDATNNWWGCNAGPGEDGCNTVAGPVNLDPWLTLTVTTDTAELESGEEATVTASLTTNSDGDDTSSDGTVPNGILVDFDVDPADAGTLDPANTSTAAGAATTTFTAEAAGEATISATVDAQTVETSVTIVSTPTPPPAVEAIELVASNTSPTAGEEVTLTATVTDAEGDPVADVTVQFDVDGIHDESGEGTTNEDGEATFSYTGSFAGTDTVTATVAGTDLSDSVEITWTVVSPPPAVEAIELVASNTSPTAGEEVTLTATVTDAEGDPVADVTVQFDVDGIHDESGEGTTNEDGEATFSYTGTYEGDDTVTATVAGTDLSDSVEITWTVVSPPPGQFPPAQPAEPKAGCIFFPQTQHNLCAGFRSYWENFGGLATFGYPVTEEFVENGLTVQYFERARFEWHPGVWPERYDVLLGLLGRDMTAGRGDEPPFQRANPGAADSCTYFEATGHNLCFGFRSYWEAFGGLAIYGYPISEEFVERNPDTGELYTVQYFERARFEWHPGEFPPRFDVLLGRIGAWALHQRYGTPYP